MLARLAQRAQTRQEILHVQSGKIESPPPSAHLAVPNQNYVPRHSWEGLGSQNCVPRLLGPELRSEFMSYKSVKQGTVRNLCLRSRRALPPLQLIVTFTRAGLDDTS